MKKIKKPLLLALAVVAAIAILGQFVRLPFFNVHPHGAIPRHTAVVLQISEAAKKQLQSDEGKSSLANLAVPTELLEDFEVYDREFASIFTQKKQEETLVILQPTKRSGMDAMFIFDGMRDNDLDVLLTKNKAWRMRKSIYKDNDVYTVQLEKSEYAFARYRNLLLFARHAYLIENALSQIERPSNSLCRESGFSSIAKKGTATAEQIPVFFNLAELGPQFSPLLDPTQLHRLDGLGNAARWLRLDLPLKNKMDWSGKFSLGEGLPIVDAVGSTKPKSFKEALGALPDNLAAFVWLSCDRISAATETGLWRTYIAPWAQDEAMVAIGEPLENGSSELFFLVKNKRNELAEEKLAALAKRLESVEVAEFQMFKLRHLTGLPLDKMLKLGSNFHDPYATVLGDYVLFSNSKTGMERWLGKYLAGQTYAKNADFLQSLRNLPTVANGLIHIESDEIWPLAAQFFDEKTLSKIGRNPLNFNELTGTFSRSGKVCELQFTASNKTIADQSAPANILWKTPLGNRMVLAPTIIRKPETGEVEIFTQDASHTIYLLSKAGRILWRRELGEPIMSKIWQLDLNSDQQVQLAFSTATGIFVVDEAGEDVAGFPLKLQTPASNGVTVVDFFKSHEYEFFIASENGTAYGFNENGSPVEGWRPKMDIGLVKLPLVHFQAKGKDFLMLLDTAGVLQVYQKNGEFRFPKKDLVGKFSQSPDFQADGENYRIVACDDHGRVSVTNLEGGDFKLALEVGKKQAVKFSFADVTGDERKDYIALSGQHLVTYFYDKKNFKKAFTYEFDQAQDIVFPVELGKRNKAYLGTFCEAKSQITMLDGQGKLLPQFPLAGTTAFYVVDLLGDGKPVLVVGNGASMMAYSL